VPRRRRDRGRQVRRCSGLRPQAPDARLGAHKRARQVSLFSITAAWIRPERRRVALPFRPASNWVLYQLDGAPRGNGSELARMAAPDAGSDKACRDAQLDRACETCSRNRHRSKDASSRWGRKRHFRRTRIPAFLGSSPKPDCPGDARHRLSTAAIFPTHSRHGPVPHPIRADWHLSALLHAYFQFGERYLPCSSRCRHATTLPAQPEPLLPSAPLLVPPRCRRALPRPQ
jgi:hypothetical protein